MSEVLPALIVRGLVKRYAGFEAVRGIDLEVEPGAVFGLLGPNGAGKTTTLRMIAGLTAPSEGSVTIFGRDLGRDPVGAKSISGFIPDRPYLYDKLTAIEYLRFIAGLYRVPHREAAERAGALLELFGLVDRAGALVESFSHGMKQRLIFAGALLPRPRLLIVDEPMVGLDPQGHRLIKGLFRTLTRDEGMTILVSTHTLQVAEEVCDRIAVFGRGRVTALGTLEELRRRAGDAEGSLESVFLRLTESAGARGAS